MEAVERQQLVPDDFEGDVEEEAPIPPQTQSSSSSKVAPTTIGSPVCSNKVFSSGDTSQCSAPRSIIRGVEGYSSNKINDRLTFVNERRSVKDPSRTITHSRPRNPHKVPVAPLGSFASRAIRHHCFMSEVPDVRHLESALLGLLEDFHSGKLRAFGKGCTMQQMTDIREQQERLARLHFDLGADTDMLGAHGDAMQQLVSHLEQLSVSIEQLHSSQNEKN